MAWFDNLFLIYVAWTKVDRRDLYSPAPPPGLPLELDAISRPNVAEERPAASDYTLQQTLFESNKLNHFPQGDLPFVVHYKLSQHCTRTFMGLTRDECQNNVSVVTESCGCPLTVLLIMPFDETQLTLITIALSGWLCRQLGWYMYVCICMQQRLWSRFNVKKTF